MRSVLRRIRDAWETVRWHANFKQDGVGFVPRLHTRLRWWISDQLFMLRLRVQQWTPWYWQMLADEFEAMLHIQRKATNDAYDEIFDLEGEIDELKADVRGLERYVFELERQLTAEVLPEVRERANTVGADDSEEFGIRQELEAMGYSVVSIEEMEQLGYFDEVREPGGL